jgi:transposase
MIRLHLPDSEHQHLAQILRTTRDAKLRHRVQIVLMAHRDRRHSTIAHDTGTSPRSVQRGLNAYLGSGLDGLRPRKAKGAPPKLTTDLASVLRQWVIDGPAACGLDRANWTYAELADYLYKTQGLRVGKSALQAFCCKHGIHPYRPTYWFLRGDPRKQATAQADLAVLKKSHGRGTHTPESG